MTRGFTLVEVLVSLLVTGLLMAVLSSVLLSGVQLSDRQDAIFSDRDAGLAIRRTLGARLDALMLVSSADRPREVYFNLNDNRLEFVSRLPRDVPFPGAHHITVTRDGDDLTMVVRTWHQGRIGDEIDRTTLLENAKGVRFAYPDSTGLPEEITVYIDEVPLPLLIGPRIATNCIMPLGPGREGAALCDGNDL